MGYAGRCIHGPGLGNTPFLGSCQNTDMNRGTLELSKHQRSQAAKPRRQWLGVCYTSASRSSTTSAAVILWKGLLSQHPCIMPHTRFETSG